MVEEPGWAIEFARLEALGMRVLPVPRGKNGPDLQVMARYCELHRPKLFVSVSVLHKPTGYCLTPASAHRIVQLADQYQFHIVEDDTYSHIASGPGSSRPVRAVSRWRCRRVASSQPNLRACLAGSIPVSTPMPWPNACWTSVT